MFKGLAQGLLLLASCAYNQFSQEKVFKGDFNPILTYIDNPILSVFSSSALVLLCDYPFFPYTSAISSFKEPMQLMTDKIETYSPAPMVFKALQLGGSRVSQALPSPVGSQSRDQVPSS